LRDRVFTLGAGSVGWQVTSGHTPVGIVKHDHQVGNPVAFNQKCLLDLCRDRGGAGTEASIRVSVDDGRRNSMIKLSVLHRPLVQNVRGGEK